MTVIFLSNGFPPPDPWILVLILIGATGGIDPILINSTFLEMLLKFLVCNTSTIILIIQANFLKRALAGCWMLDAGLCKI